MPSTLVHALVPGACAWISRSGFPPLERRKLLAFLVLAACLGNAPDLDLIPAFFAPDHWREIHRNWGHNLFSVALWVFLGARALTYFIHRDFRGRLGYVTAACLVGSHLLFDSLQGLPPEGGRPGVPLFWPLSEAGFRLPFPIFRPVHIDHALNPVYAHFVSPDFWHHIFYQEILRSFCFILAWYLIFSSTQRRKRRPSAR